MRVFVRSLLVLVALGLLTTHAAQAQNPTIGFKLGPSFSKLATDEPDADLKWMTKFMGGGFMRWALAAFGVQPELMYNTKGAKMSGEGVDVELRFDYIEVPLLFVLPLSRGPGVQPHLYAGPAFAFEVGCTIAASGQGVGMSFDCDEAGDEVGAEVDRKKFDVGAMVGAGIGIPMGPGSVLLEGRYNHGLINIAAEGTARHRNFAALIGYSIPIGARY
jgi:hypothetical protein